MARATMLLVSLPFTRCWLQGMFFVSGLTLTTAVSSATTRNGFDISESLIPVDEIHHGGPPRDGIPALVNPQFVQSDGAHGLAANDRVLGVAHGGVAKAYPIRILDYHEIVNDLFHGEPIVITYCPLCGTGMAFSARAAGMTRTFGVSGLLYNSDVLLYDRQSESLWSQILGRAVTGPLKGHTLKGVPLAHTTWADWRSRYPETLVLSRDTGYRRDYTRSPYPGYEASERIYFPVSNTSRRYHPKERVIGVEIDGEAKVYPFAELAKGPAVVDDQLAGRSIRVEFDAEHRTGRVLNARGDEIPSVIAYWFAWIAFHPDTAIYVDDPD